MNDFKFLFYHNNKENIKICKQNGFDVIIINGDWEKEIFYPEDDHLNNKDQLYLKEKFVEKIINIIP